MDRMGSKIQVMKEWSLNAETQSSYIKRKKGVNWIETYLKMCDRCGVKSNVMFSMLLI